MSSGADINMRCHRMWTPLHFAAFGNKPEAVKFLIDAGADVNAHTDDAGWTLLILAIAGQGYPAVVAILLQSNHININEPDANGNSPLEYAKTYNHPAIIEMLLAHPKILK